MLRAMLSLSSRILIAFVSGRYKNNLASFHSQNVGMSSGVMDIEDLLAVGKREIVSRVVAV